jgi:hypothetical protein
MDYRKEKIEDKAIEIKMIKYVKSSLLTKTTDEATAIVANEPTADMPQLVESYKTDITTSKRLTKITTTN